MMQTKTFWLPALLLAALVCPHIAVAQNPTAIQKLQLSAFGGVSPDFTGLSGGKNVAITAGVDLALPPVYHLRPTAEFRGTYPIDGGTIDSQREVLGGLRVDFLLGRRIHPYGDFLFGRGEMKYGGSGYFFGNFDYDLTTTNVYSPGAGLDYDLTSHFAVKADGQFQRWGGAPTPSGTVYAKVATVALVYHIDFNRRPR
jgi:hypothetical protein